MTDALLADLWNASNPLLMFAVGGLAVVLHRLEIITARTAIIAPMAIGALWGPVVVLGHARDMGGWTRPEVALMQMFEAAFVNGFAATVAGRFLSGAWDLLPWGGKRPPSPRDPHAGGAP